ncbi:MAG: hypothetical protein ACRDNB_04885 [Gaiellaceae bacterium]
MTPNRWLAAFAVAVSAGQHLGALPDGLGEVGTTRVVDWIDLAVPYAVVATAAAVIASVQAPRRVWLVFAGGAIAYTQGHGIHLAANSIANVDSSDVAHLWDEVVGHYVWYGGLAAVVAALALAAGGRAATRSPVAIVLAILFGFTVFTNSVEGGTPLLGLATGIGFLVWGLRQRDRLAGLLVPAYAVAVAGLLGWGAYWQGWPQFSELGWI